MKAKADFDTLVARGGGRMRPVLEKEPLHYDVHERTFGRAGFERFLLRETDRLLAPTAGQPGGALDHEDYRI